MNSDTGNRMNQWSWRSTSPFARRWICRTLLHVSALLLLLGGPSWVAVAQAQWTMIDGTRPAVFQTITNPTVGATGGLNISVRPLHELTSQGYSRYQFRVTPSKGGRFPANATLELALSNEYSQGGKAKYVLSIPIEAGDTLANGEALVCLTDTQYVSIQARLDGRRLEGNSTVLQSNFYGGYNPQKDRILCLLSESSAGLTSPRSTAFTQLQKDAPWFLRGKADSNTERSYGKLAEIPENWLELTNFSQIDVDASDLHSLDEKTLSKLRLYVMAGGVLSVQRMENRVEIVKKFFRGNQWKMLERFQADASIKTKRVPNNYYGNQAVPIDASNETRWSDFSLPTFDILPNTVWDEYWTKTVSTAQLREQMGYIPNPRYFNPTPVYVDNWFDNFLRPESKKVAISYLDYRMMFATSWYSQLRAFSDVQTQVKDVTDAVGPLTIRFGFGIVYLPDNRRINDEEVIAIGTANQAERFTSGIGNEFWDWLIPSVGKTPAFAFLAFVGVFVGGVAPGLMYWSNRKGRRVWLLLLMPITALACTLGLFTFGLLKDGFASESRIRSVTFLDGQDEGLVWSRQAFFSASVPASGFSVSSTTMLTPLVANKIEDLPYYTVTERDNRRYFQGLLPPRIQSQFSLMHPTGKLNVVKRTEQQDTVLNAKQIVNGSDSMTWVRAAFIDPNGECFVAENVAPGQVASFQSQSQDATTSFLLASYNAVPLVAPVDAPDVDQQSLGGIFFGYRRWGVTRAQGDFTEELLWRQKLGGSVPNNSLPVPLTTFSPSSFVIFVDKAPHLEKCLETANESAGLHAIFGRWE